MTETHAQDAQVDEVVLRDLKISPCLEPLYGLQAGRALPHQGRLPGGLRPYGLMLASPIFFYVLSAQAKIFMDRCQGLWVKKYWIDKQPFGGGVKIKKGLLISVGTTKGPRLLEGALLSVPFRHHEWN